jgi:ABC-2 type transport system ATP-binding protein
MSAIICVDNLVKQYDKAKSPAVDNISFEVGEGEFFAFLGPNGAGKTTTISILTTTLNKTSGTVTIAGYNLEKEAKLVRENIGIIFQKPSLDLTLSAEENIRFHACLYGMYGYRPSFSMMPPAYKDRVMELAEIVGIKDSLWKPVKKLSGGMQRKLEIIRSLIHTPKILFLDEPTQGLDAVSRRSLWSYINDVRKEYGTTVFLTTHYIDEAENVDKVCVINNGKIAMCVSPEKMKAHLMKQELILDARDQEVLEMELTDLGVKFVRNSHFAVQYQGASVQNIIARLKTPLTVLKLHEPSLEDAYVELLRKDSEVA